MLSTSAYVCLLSGYLLIGYPVESLQVYWVIFSILICGTYLYILVISPFSAIFVGSVFSYPLVPCSFS